MAHPTTSSFEKGARPVALVTGGAKRLGREIALTLANAGWSIALHYRSSHQEALATQADLLALGGQCEVLQADLSIESEVMQLATRAAGMGPLRCVVNNASLFEYDNAQSFTYAALMTHVSSNLAAPIVLARELFKHTPEGEQSVVVNLLDQKLEHLNPDFLSYTLSKAALAAANTMLAQELAPKVRVVGVSPGLTLISHMQTQEQFAKMHQLSPLKRSSQPQDIANTVLFAVNNPSLTGMHIVVDGGQHLLGLGRDFSVMQHD
jgi:NAD(P)-dependent dehydrogenase (short-subunit alcohol dehydrogenase family)